MYKWLIGLSLITTLVLTWVAWDAYNQPWTGYQKAYHEMVRLNAPGKWQRDWAQSQRLEIKQYYLPELGRVERCSTCHVGVDNPAFRAAPQPLREHNALLDSHPPERFGCISCHGGEGRAVTVDGAHGEGKEATKRLLKGEYLKAACYSCHGQETLPPSVTAPVVQGMQLVNRYQCLRCHQIKGEGGSEGPDLSVSGSRRDWIWLYGHFISPQAMNPISTMPRFLLSREEIKYLTAFLLTLRDKGEQITNSRFIARTPASEGWRWPEERASAGNAFPGAELIPPGRYDGQKLFQGTGCVTCHTIGRRGGEVGPGLTYIARTRDREWLVRLLKDPAQVLPRGQMPQLYLNEKQIEALADYLTTLK